MADSSQLSKNNQNGKIWENWSNNTERDFKSCISDVLNTIQSLYPEYSFYHVKSIKNASLIDIFKKHSSDHTPTLNGSNGGGCNPDGGVIFIQCKDGLDMPVLIGENKHQNDNPGNAIERSVKNIDFFKNFLIEENYFPYLININGGIVNPNKGSLFDRITQSGGFMAVNSVHVRSDSKTPRLRPFTVILDREFNYDKVKDLSLCIIKESIGYLKDANKL